MTFERFAAARPRLSTRAAGTFLVAVLAVSSATSALAQPAPPSFSKSFSPSDIGPGSAASLVFIIDTGDGDAVDNMAFTDTLPAGLTLASPALPTTDCPDATLSAPDGGDTITFSDGELGQGATCTVEVLVTGATPGTYMNVSGDLTSSLGNSGPASADLVVDPNLPGLTKAFAPSPVPLGSRSTLTFTIDNSLNDSNVGSLDFTDELPAGMVVADPPNAATDCVGDGDDTTLTADAGTRAIVLDANGTSFFPGFEVLSAGGTCTVSVDIVTTGAGELENVSSDLLADFLPAGRAARTLSSTAGDIVLIKEFLADPVPPGGTVDLEFTILNRTRADQAIDIAFTDDLGATLAGLTAVGLPAPVCGGTLTGTTNLAFTGGSVPPASECAFAVSLQVPAGAAQGIYPNTTGVISADFGGPDPVSGNAAADDLFVFAAPVLEKTFLDDPAAAGGSTRMEFTITNSSLASAATDIAFIDELTTFLPFPVSATLPANGFCGPASSMGLDFLGTDRQGLSMADGELAPGASCTFEVTLDLPAGLPGGVYTNTTREITAAVDGENAIGAPASADFTVVAPPFLTKAFTDDPVLPGNTVTLEFILEHDELASGDATGIAFTDDLDATLGGLVATGLPDSDVCGAGSQISGTSTLAFSGGSLAPGETCAFSVSAQVPMGANPGTYSNATSEVTATVSGLTATGPAATDNLLVTGLSFSKEFIDDPVIAGDTATLRFTIDNDGSLAAAGIGFSDVLDDNLAGLTVASIPAAACGGSLVVVGSATLVLSNGSVAAGTSCSFDTTVQVPAGTADGAYPNTTSDLTATEGGVPVSLPPATDDLLVDSTLLALSKQILGDPVLPGETLILEVAVTNLSSTDAVSAIALTDDLGAALAGLTAASEISNDCGFTVGGLGTAMLSLTDGNLAAASACTVQVQLQVPGSAPAGLYTNTTSDATGDVGGLAVTGAAASDDFRVVNVTFVKSFDGPSVAGGTPALNFTITNNDSNSGISGLAFTDDLNAVLPGLATTGLPLSNVCGSGSSIGGTTFLTFQSGSLGPNASCSFSVPLAVPAGAAPGSYANITSALSSAGLFAASPASANLSIQPPPTFGKVFADPAIAIDGTSRLTFTIDNTASMVAATGLEFVDNLPAGLEVAGTPNVSTTCTGGTLTAVAGSGAISYTGGAIAAGASCTLSVDVAGTTEGTFVNTSGALTSSSGNSGTASDQIDVVSGDFVVAKSFRSEPVLPAGLVEMEISIVNGSAFPLVGIALTDDLDATLTDLVAEGLPVPDVCGTGSEISGASTISLTGGSLPAGASCTIVVPVRVPGDAPEGAFPNTTSTATGTREGIAVEADPGTADLVVADLVFEKTLDPNVAPQDSTVTATFRIANPDPANGVSALAFSDNLDQFIVGMTALNTPILDACGSGSLVDGTSQISLAGGTLGGGGSCSFEVTLQIPPDTRGDFLNETSPLTANVDGTAITVPFTTATLIVPGPPDFAKSFSTNAILVGGVSTLTLDIDNSDGLLSAEMMAFDDNLPAGMSVAAAPAVSNTCGGTLVADPGTDLIRLTDGSVAADSVCRIEVDITADAVGTATNVTGDLTSSLGNSGTASASLDVVSGEFVVAKSFLTEPVLPGGLVDLEFSISNDSEVPMSEITFSDDLGAALAGLSAEDLPLTDVCGIGSQVSGISVVTLTAGRLEANESCSFVVGVRVPAGAPAGTFVNTTSIATGMRQGVQTEAAPARADLVVEPLAFTKAFDPVTVTAGGTITATFEITNSDPANPVDGLTFSDDLDAFVPGMTATDTPISDACGTGSLLTGTSTITLTGGELAAGGSCTFEVTLEVPADTAAGDFTNITSPLEGAAGGTGTGAAAASAVLAVQPPPTFAKAFSPDVILVREVSTLSFVIDNSASQLDATMLTFDDNLPTGLSIAPVPAVSNACGGTLVADPGTDLIRLTGGSIGAGSVCTLRVDVVATIAGTLTNVTDDLTFDPGNGGAATARIRVGEALAVPVFDNRWAFALALLLAALGWRAMNTRQYKTRALSG